MRPIYRALLWLVTTAIPVFIAACYGVAYRFSRAGGRVVDAGSGEGIEGISVSCVKDDVVQATASTAAGGSFVLEFDETMPCDTLRAEDVDGEANGAYETKSVPFDGADAGEQVIELDPVS